MRSRTIATVALLCCLLIPAAVAQATPRADDAVARSQLLALMAQRRQLVASLAAQDSARGRLLLESALATAEAVLSADAAALRRAMVRHMPVRVASHAVAASAPAAPPALVAAPGALWSPLVRAVAPTALSSLLALATQNTRPDAARNPVAPPLAISLTSLTSWASLLPTAPTAAPHAATSAATATPRATRPRPAPTVPITNPGDAAASYGGLTIDGGDGAMPLVGANAVVAAAIQTPTTAGTSGEAASSGTVEQPPDLATLTRRWRAVAGALAQVRAVEQWARATDPTSGVTPNDVIPSPAVLSQRLDQWSADPTLDPALADALSTALSALLVAPVEGMGATVSLISGVGAAITTSVGLSATLGVTHTAGLLLSNVADVTATGIMSETIGATMALSSAAPLTSSAISTPAATETATATVQASASSTPMTGTPTLGAGASGTPDTSTTTPTTTATLTTPVTTTATATATATAPITATSAPMTTAIPTSAPMTMAIPTSTPAAESSASSTPEMTASPTGTPATVDGTAPVASPSTTPTMTATVEATATPTNLPTSASTLAQPTGALSMTVVANTPIITLTTDLSETAPLTLVVTLPVTAAHTLAPPGFQSQRGALESVLRQGEALYAQLQASQAAAEQQYRHRLAGVVATNNVIQQRWFTQYQARVRYRGELAAYRARVKAWNAYAHQVHLSQLAHDTWAKRLAAWTRYAQEMAAYKVALAAWRQAPSIPISGTVTAPRARPPAKPVMPVFPGPEPTPYSGPAPAWPGAAPPYAANPGPEPSGYALPLPPQAVPPWAGALPPLAVLNAVGDLSGPDAAGLEETTQAALIADGALDGVLSYQDPLKGPIATYWGGQTPFQSFHTGIDIAAPMYTPIRAAAAGKVIWAGYAVAGQRHESYGLCVVIQHNAHFSTLYAHMDDQVYGLAVRQGDLVAQGQVIGYVGLTGWTTGPHLHFEMRENNVQFNPLLLLPNPQD